MSINTKLTYFISDRTYQSLGIQAIDCLKKNFTLTIETVFMTPMTHKFLSMYLEQLQYSTVKESKDVPGEYHLDVQTDLTDLEIEDRRMILRPIGISIRDPVFVVQFMAKLDVGPTYAMHKLYSEMIELNGVMELMLRHQKKLKAEGSVFSREVAYKLPKLNSIESDYFMDLVERLAEKVGEEQQENMTKQMLIDGRRPTSEFLDKFCTAIGCEIIGDDRYIVIYYDEHQSDISLCADDAKGYNYLDHVPDKLELTAQIELDVGQAVDEADNDSIVADDEENRMVKYELILTLHEITQT